MALHRVILREDYLDWYAAALRKVGCAASRCRSRHLWTPELVWELASCTYAGERHRWENSGEDTAYAAEEMRALTWALTRGPQARVTDAQVLRSAALPISADAYSWFLLCFFCEIWGTVTYDIPEDAIEALIACAAELRIPYPFLRLENYFVGEDGDPQEIPESFARLAHLAVK